jgi:hypothetical protein
MKKIFILFITLTSAIFSHAQNNVFVQQKDGSYYFEIEASEGQTINSLSSKYFVNEEILQLFNNFTSGVPLMASEKVNVPLVETNYYKNYSIGANAGFIPLFYKCMETESMQSICRKFLVTESTVSHWNANIQSNIPANTNVQIGWLKVLTNPVAKTAIVNPANNASVPALSNYKPGNTFQEDVKIDYEIAKAKVSATAKKVSSKVQNFFNPSLKINEPKTPNAASKVSTNTAVNITPNANNTAVNNTTIVKPVVVETKPKEAVVAKVVNPNAKPSASTVIQKNVQQAGAAVNKTANQVGTFLSKTAKQAGDGIKNTANKMTAKPVPAQPTISVKKVEEPSIEIKKEEVEVVKNTEIFEPVKEDIKMVESNTQNNGASIYELAAGSKKSEEIIEVKAVDNNTGIVAKVKKTEVPVVVKPIVKQAEKKILKTANGKAITFYMGGMGSHFAYTDFAPKDSKIIVTNKRNGKQVEATVMGPLRKDSETEEGIFILLSDTVKKILQPSDENFMVEVSLVE